MQDKLFGENVNLFEQKDCLNDSHSGWLHAAPSYCVQLQGLLFTGTKCSVAGGGGAAAGGGQQKEDLSARVCMSTIVRFGQRLGKAQSCPRLCIRACLCFAESEIPAGCNFPHKPADLKRGSGVLKEEKMWRVAACVQSGSQVLCRCDLGLACVSCFRTYGSFT